LDADPKPGMLSLKGLGGVIVAVVVVTALCAVWPAYRLFFLISVGIGLAVAVILYLWHRHNPVSEGDVENKRPLGLD
jgi:sugar phosphate permease